jgi:hypothetical protein
MAREVQAERRFVSAGFAVREGSEGKGGEDLERLHRISV